MICHGVTPNPALCKAMLFTDSELSQLNRGSLRKDCEEMAGGKFYAMYRAKGNKVHLGTYSSLEACNAAWDKEDLRRKNEKIRVPALKGYTTRKLENGTAYTATVCFKGSSRFLKTYYVESEARAIHVEAVAQINAGTFEGWFKKIKASSN